MRIRHNESGFGAIEIVIIFVVLIGIVGAGLLVWHSKKDATTTSVPTKSSTATDSTSTDSTASSGSDLPIPSWGVKLTQVSNLAVEEGSNVDAVTITGPGKNGGTASCGVIQRKSVADNPGSPDFEGATAVAKLNGYYYVYISFSVDASSGCASATEASLVTAVAFITEA